MFITEPHTTFRIAAALPLEQFFPPEPLEIFLIPNLQPVRLLQHLRANLVLSYDPFEVAMPTFSSRKLSTGRVFTSRVISSQARHRTVG